MEGPAGKFPHAFSLNRHRVEAGLEHDSLETLGQSVFAARTFCRQFGAQKTSRSKGGHVFEVFDDMEVHWHDDFLAGFLLLIADNTLFGENSIPFHLHTIAEPRPDEITEQNQSLP